MSIDAQTIRRNTQIALPDDDGYLFRLGVALYGFASINSFMIEIITHLDPHADRTSLDNSMSGKVLKKFRNKVEKWGGDDISEPAGRAATEFEQLNIDRNDIVHSYPITNSVGEQILHRRVDAKNKYFEVTNAFLDDFTRRLTLVSGALYEIRVIVRPEL
jgi:hypothetical protein